MIDHAKVRPGDVFTFSTPSECDGFVSAQRHYRRRVQRTKIAEGEYRCTVYDPAYVPPEVRQAMKRTGKKPAALKVAAPPDDRKWRAFYARVGDMRRGDRWALRMPRQLSLEEYEAVREHLRDMYPQRRLHFGPRRGLYLRLSRLDDD